MSHIPVIDISPLVALAHGIDSGSDHEITQGAKNVAQQIAHACTTYGFFAITRHGVDSSIIDDAWSASRDFFAMESSIKSSVPMQADYPYGYEAHESLGIKLTTNKTTTATIAPDSKETFSIGPQNSTKSGMPPRRFPEGASDKFAPSLTRYFESMEKLARVLFRGLALALELEDPSWFLREDVFDEGHQCALRILNYPQLEYEEDNELVRIRAGAHTDYGAFTILKSGGPGLQLQLSPGGEDGNESGGEWIDVPHLSDAFVINLGDLMQRWTNERWRSTLHRVIAVADTISESDNNNPGKNIIKSSQRQSIAFFVNMNGSATIVPFESCVDDEHPSRYDAIKASSYLIQRHAQSMGESKK